MKKVFSMGLALVMCLALMIPVFAAEQQFSTENESLTPTIEVEMPASAGVVLNPYKMTYAAGGILGTSTSQEQVFSNVFYITNKTQGANLKVQTTVTGVMAGNAQLVAENDTGLETNASDTVIGKKFLSTEKGNKVLMALLYNYTNAIGTAPTTVTGIKSAAIKKFITDSDLELDEVVLNPATSTTSSYVVYEFKGIAVSEPDTAWASTDKVGATFVYTFTATADAATAS